MEFEKKLYMYLFMESNEEHANCRAQMKPQEYVQAKNVETT